MSIDTLEDEIKKALRTFSVSTSAGDFELRPTGEKLIVEQIKQALNLYIEGKEKAAELRALGKYEYGERFDKLDEAGIEILITYHKEQLSKLRAAKRASGLK